MDECYSMPWSRRDGKKCQSFLTSLGRKDRVSLINFTGHDGEVNIIETTSTYVNLVYLLFCCSVISCSFLCLLSLVLFCLVGGRSW